MTHEAGFPEDEAPTRTDLPAVVDERVAKPRPSRPGDSKLPSVRPPARSGVSFARPEIVALDADDARRDPFEEVRYRAG